MTHLFELTKEDYNLVEKTNYLLIKEQNKPLKEGDTIVLQYGHEESVKTLSHISDKEMIGLKPNYIIINLKDKE